MLREMTGNAPAAEESEINTVLFEVSQGESSLTETHAGKGLQ